MQFQAMRHTAVALLYRLLPARLRMTKVEAQLPEGYDATRERLWAVKTGTQRYRIESIPFATPNINLHDIVECRTYASDGTPIITRVVTPSSNTTIRLRFQEHTPSEQRHAILKRLRIQEATWEKMNINQYILNIPQHAPYVEIMQRLEEDEAAELLWIYTNDE